YVGRVREHIHHPGGFELEIVLVHEQARIAGEGARMTRDIDDARRPGGSDHRQHFTRTGTRRVEQDFVVRTLSPSGPCEILSEEIRGMELYIGKSIARRVLSSPRDERSLALHCGDACAAPRDR